MRRVGIMGGTFDPVHYGHLIAAGWALGNLALERVLFIPNNQSPLKDAGPIASFTNRCRMLELAIADTDAFVLSDIEGRRPGISFTVDTLSALQAESEGTELYLLLGADAVADFDRWKDPEGIRALARIVAISRAGDRGAAASAGDVGLDMPRVDISSSLIRSRLAAGESIVGLTPQGVVDFISTHRLYGKT